MKFFTLRGVKEAELSAATNLDTIAGYYFVYELFACEEFARAEIMREIAKEV
jgi:hypothetical protein